MVQLLMPSSDLATRQMRMAHVNPATRQSSNVVPLDKVVAADETASAPVGRCPAVGPFESSLRSCRYPYLDLTIDVPFLRRPHVAQR